MSGAKKKLAQKEAMAQMGLTDKEKKALADAAKKKRNVILAAVAGVVALVLVAALLVWDSGVIERHTTALKVNGHEYSVADMDFFYRQTVFSAYNNEVSWYEALANAGYDIGDYTPSFDPYSDLRTQYVDEEKTQTYYDYFMDQTKTQVAQITAMADAAKAEGYTLSEDGQTQLNDSIADLDETVRNSGLASRAALFARSFGNGVNEKVYLKNLELSLLASDYQSATVAKMTEYTDEDLDAYYKEHTDLYNSYDYNFVYFDGTPVQKTDDDGETIPATDEETAAAKAEAKKQAEALLADVKAAQTATLAEGESRKTFADVAAAYTTSSTSSTRKLGADLKSNVYFEWLSDASRKEGDVDMFEADSGCYVVQFLKSYLYDEPTVDVRHILVKAETDEDAELNENNVPKPTQAQMDAAHDAAEDLLKQFNLGEQTADAFGELAEEHSDDGRKDDGSLNAAGGLYSDVHKGQMVANFNDWIFDASRKEGDVGLVENAGPGYFGWHVVYFQAVHEPQWMGASNGARATKASEDQDNWLESVQAGYEAVATTALSKVDIHR